MGEVVLRKMKGVSRWGLTGEPLALKTLIQGWKPAARGVAVPSSRYESTRRKNVQRLAKQMALLGQAGLVQPTSIHKHNFQVLPWRYRKKHHFYW